MDRERKKAFSALRKQLSGPTLRIGGCKGKVGSPVSVLQSPQGKVVRGQGCILHCSRKCTRPRVSVCSPSHKHWAHCEQEEFQQLTVRSRYAMMLAMCNSGAFPSLGL